MEPSDLGVPLISSDDCNTDHKSGAGGDQQALECLLIDHSNGLRTHLRRGLPTRVKGLLSVEDVVQETLYAGLSQD